MESHDFPCLPIRICPVSFAVRSRQRAVAQSGSALHWGCRGRGFESRQPDHQKPPLPLAGGFWFPGSGPKFGGWVVCLDDCPFEVIDPVADVGFGGRLGEAKEGTKGGGRCRRLIVRGEPWILFSGTSLSVGNPSVALDGGAFRRGQMACYAPLVLLSTVGPCHSIRPKNEQGG